LGFFGFDPPQDVDSVQAGKAAIENQQVIIEFGCQSSGLLAIVQHVHGVVLCFERALFTRTQRLPDHLRAIRVRIWLGVPSRYRLKIKALARCDRKTKVL